MKFNQLLYCFLLLGLASCSAPETTTLPLQESFFDLEGYFSEEAERLASVKRIRKKTSVDGKTEENTIEEPDLAKALKVFEAAGINRTAWLDKYVVDSLMGTDGMLRRLNYQALDEEMKTRSLDIIFKGTAVDSILIVRSSSSVVANMEQHLSYVPLSGFSIQSKQKTSLSDEHVLAVEVQFLP